MKKKYLKPKTEIMFFNYKIICAPSDEGWGTGGDEEEEVVEDSFFNMSSITNGIGADSDSSGWSDLSLDVIISDDTQE